MFEQNFHDKWRHGVANMPLNFPFAKYMCQRESLKTGQFSVSMRPFPTIVPDIGVGNDRTGQRLVPIVGFPRLIIIVSLGQGVVCIAIRDMVNRGLDSGQGCETRLGAVRGSRERRESFSGTSGFY